MNRLVDLTCIRCGESFQHNKDREYCSNSCRVAIHRRRKQGILVHDVKPVCERCGLPFDSVRNNAKRCVECQGKTTPIFSEKECPCCNATFMPIKADQESCSNSCAQKMWKKANRKPEPWDDRRRANYHKRRALKMALPADNVRPIEVYERDKWICGICEKPVNKVTSWPDPSSPSLDHVVPLSLGGHHVYENVQLAHLRCNVSKGARVEV